LEPRHVFKKRSLISAPIMEKGKRRSFLERHSKPYFLKIIKEGSSYKGRILCLPYQYGFGLKEMDTKVKEYMSVIEAFNKRLYENGMHLYISGGDR